MRWRRQGGADYRKSGRNQSNTFSSGTESCQSEMQLVAQQPDTAARAAAGFTMAQTNTS
jgi:hypothetical protein